MFANAVALAPSREGEGGRGAGELLSGIISTAVSWRCGDRCGRDDVLDLLGNEWGASFAVRIEKTGLAGPAKEHPDEESTCFDADAGRVDVAD
jgi:hypothetical protein